MDWEAFYNNFRSPDFISGYEIQNRLGGGAFGDVYKARKQSIGKPYAIKFLKVEDEHQREAVQRELEQVRHFAAIDHPNLVTIEDMGTVLGVPYLIMGYAGEDTLARRLKSGPLRPDDALLYFTQACRGVLALHDRRLVHFDLKPSNVFLKGEVARVGDYGLSKLLTDGRMTLSFGRGTPQYMAPEILRSRADHRADVYSLGVILFEALAGRLPFEPSPEGGLVLREDDAPPEFPEDFPAASRPVVERCLRLSPDDRFSEVGELLETLGQTARQGDSVRFDWSETAGRGDAAVPTAQTEGVEQAEGSDAASSGRSSSELRRTAADLARGAAGVARGMWDGLRAEREEEELEVEPPPPPPPEEEPEPQPAGAGGVRGALTSAQRDLTRAGREIQHAVGNVRDSVTGSGERIRSGHAAGKQRARALVDGLRRRPRPTSEGGARPHAVPVPPRVQGGFLGTLAQTAVVGFEVLVALVGNLLRGVVRVFRTLVDRLLRRTGGLVGRVLGVLGFVLFMAALGFVVMLVGMVFLDAVGVRT